MSEVSPKEYSAFRLSPSQSAPACLQALIKGARLMCQTVNHSLAKNKGSRTTGRFIDLNLQDESILKEDGRSLQERSNIACIATPKKGPAQVYYGCIQRICKRGTAFKSGKLNHMAKVDLDDGDAHVICLWYSPVRGRGRNDRQLRDEQGRLIFDLPLVSSNWGFNERIPMESVLSAVTITEAEDGDQKGRFVLSIESEQAMDRLQDLYLQDPTGAGAEKEKISKI